jgi:hypothetical protein
VHRSSAISALLKRLGAPLVIACALMFAFAPLVDSFVCGTSADSGGQTSAAAVVETSEHEPVRSMAGSDGSCVHGHCHHGATVPRDGSDASTVRLASVSLPEPVGTTEPSAFLSGIERPPRA